MIEENRERICVGMESNPTLPNVKPPYCHKKHGRLLLLIKKTISVFDVSGDDEDVGAAAVVAMT
jgi:hypothetical protein